MISQRISNEIKDILSSNVNKISLSLFEEILEVRDTMIRFNEYTIKGTESVTALLLEEIVQTILEELLTKIDISKK